MLATEDRHFLSMMGSVCSPSGVRCCKPDCPDIAGRQYTDTAKKLVKNRKANEAHGVIMDARYSKTAHS